MTTDQSLEINGFRILASALDGNLFPFSDADDMNRGAQFIPAEVTDARRMGHKIKFVTNCGPCCWYWEMPDHSRIYHFVPMTHNSIAEANGREGQSTGIRNWNSKVMLDPAHIVGTSTRTVGRSCVSQD